MPLALGPYELLTRIGSGAVGEVWSARHVALDFSVAIKVLRAAAAPWASRALHDEARAVAALDHPHIARVYDFGTVPDRAARSAGGALVAGSPMLVMEYAALGDLRHRALPWPQVHRVLLDVLDGLAHVHARGLVHLDIKPSNILELERDRFALGDFGIARALWTTGDRSGGGVFGGTPTYMAPEQAARSWRAFGPWTDLYAVGTTAWALLTGEAPYGELDLHTASDAHGFGTLPELRARVAIPAGLEGWLRRLLQKDPRARYPCAADAAWALVQIVRAGGWAAPTRPAGTGRLPAEPRAPGVGTEVLHTGGSDRTTLRWTEDTEAPAVRPSSGTGPGGGGGSDVPPMPLHWEPGHWKGRAPPGVGLGLLDVRTPELVDREDERTALWRLLADVRAHGHTRLAVLRGPAGFGKTRLARWVSERAEEVGGAEVLRATHEPIPSATSGLVAMLQRHLRCHGLGHDRIVDHVRAVLPSSERADPSTASELAELLSPTGPLVRSEETRALYGRVLSRLGGARPVLLHIDDAQWGAEALELARWLLREHETRALMVVLTVQDEALSERPAEAGLLRELLEQPSVVEIRVGPLPAHCTRALVRDALGLGGALAERVEAHTAGNPLFAVALVGDWVARDQLRATPRGFTLADGADLSLPADLHRTWAERVDWLLDGRPHDDGVALELAAVLGVDVDRAEWQAACDQAGVRRSDELLSAVMDAHLARPGREPAAPTLSLAHGMLRETLLQRARSSGRYEDHHTAVGVALAARGAPALRIGQHLLAAGALAEALEPLLRGVERALQTGDIGLATSWLDDVEQAMSTLELPDDDERWGRMWLDRARIAIVRRRPLELAQLGEQLDVTAQRHGWTRVRMRALKDRALAAGWMGNTEQALEWLAASEDLAEHLGDRLYLAETRRARGALMAGIGNNVDALGELHAAAALLGEGDPMFLGSTWYWIAYCEQTLGHAEAALDAIETAERHYRARTSRVGLADCANLRGELLRAGGRTEAARDAYTAALEHYRHAGADGMAVFPTLNLAFLALSSGAHADAERTLIHLLAQLKRDGLTALAGKLHAPLMACAASRGGWSDFDRHLQAARAALRDQGSADLDSGACARDAGLAAERAEQPARARAALELARAHFERLARADEVAAIDAALERLGR